MTHQKQGNNELHFFYDSKSSIVGFTLNGGAYTYLKNLQGDVIGIVDGNGNKLAEYSYDSWGNIISQSGPLSYINPIRYKGYYYDSDTGMYYLQSRYYDPALRRFINADDPSLIEELVKSSVIGSNLFSYCDNNGINKLDPNGKLFTFKLIVKAVFAAIFGLIVQFVSDIIKYLVKFIKNGKAKLDISPAGEYVSSALSWALSTVNPFSKHSKIIGKLADLIPLFVKYIDRILNGKKVNYKELFSDIAVLVVSTIISIVLNRKMKKQIKELNKYFPKRNKQKRKNLFKKQKSQIKLNFKILGKKISFKYDISTTFLLTVAGAIFNW